jgi:hypothetical protein
VSGGIVGGAKAGHDGEALLLVLPGAGGFPGEVGDRRLVVEGIDRSAGSAGRGIGGGTREDRGLVDVLAVDVDGVGDEGRATVAAARVALLESHELELGLQALKEARHFERVWE